MTSAFSWAAEKSGGAATPVEAFLHEPKPHSHAVQFYEDTGSLFETVATFLAAGLDAGDPLLVIATEAHRRAFIDRLGPTRAAAAIASGQLKLLDASETLASFMLGDMPDRELFQEMLRRALSDLQDSYPGALVRAYGEMVELLWRSGNSRAAIRLEEFWCDACESSACSLLCAYAMGHFHRESERAQFIQLCRLHTHVIPIELLADIGDDDSPSPAPPKDEIRQPGQLEHALRAAVRERARVEEELRASVQREREARTHAQACDAFAQALFALLGQHLRDPLASFLTTTRMTSLGRELPPESREHLGRMISSADRTRRTIEQVLDVTRAKLSSGMPIDPRHEPDLAPRALKVIEAILLAHPGRIVEFRAARPCPAHVDGDRFEQVLSNLLGNAVAHGDPERCITVTLESPPGRTRLCVHNHGRPIDPDFRPMLFDPFRRGGSSPGRSAALGLGLYLSRSIVHAHGGEVRVESTAEAGTTFEVIVPRA